MREFVVHRDDRLVLRVRDNPGTLRSTAAPGPRRAPPPPGRPPGTTALPQGVHPFIDAQAHDPVSEGALRALLDESTSFDDYLRRLVDAGYVVTPTGR